MHIISSPQQLRQLGDSPQSAAFRHGWQRGSRPATGLVLAIDEGERLPVGVAHDETRGGLLDGPRRWEAALRRHGGPVIRAANSFATLLYYQGKNGTDRNYPTSPAK
jgi:hypothetical protein